MAFLAAKSVVAVRPVAAARRLLPAPMCPSVRMYSGLGDDAERAKRNIGRVGDDVSNLVSKGTMSPEPWIRRPRCPVYSASHQSIRQIQPAIEPLCSPTVDCS